MFYLFIVSLFPKDGLLLLRLGAVGRAGLHDPSQGDLQHIIPIITAGIIIKIVVTIIIIIIIVYEDFTRLAENRLARNSLSYL